MTIYGHGHLPKVDFIYSVYCTCKKWRTRLMQVLAYTMEHEFRHPFLKGQSRVTF
jgi:hypothetical protein